MMSRIEDVLVPPNEEGTRATILRWCKAVGDTVAKDEALVELETDKVTVEVPAPVSGTLIEILKPESTEVSPNEVLARVRLAGEVPSPINPPPGCHFHTRCPIAQFPRCKSETPALRQASDGHWVACHFR